MEPRDETNERCFRDRHLPCNPSCVAYRGWHSEEEKEKMKKDPELKIPLRPFNIGEVDDGSFVGGTHCYDLYLKYKTAFYIMCRARENKGL